MLPNKSVTLDNLFLHKNDLVFHFAELRNRCSKCVRVDTGGWQVTLDPEDISRLSVQSLGFLIEYTTRIKYDYDEEGIPIILIYADIQEPNCAV